MKRFYSSLLLVLVFIFSAVNQVSAQIPVSIYETEPNGTSGTAQVLNLAAQNVTIVRGSINPGGDLDYFRIDGVVAGSRIWLVTDPGGTQVAGATSRDLVMDLLQSDGTSVIENDDDDGTGNGGDGTIETGLAATIGGRILVTGGTYYISLRAFSAAGIVNPYRLFVAVTPPGAGSAEVEANNTAATANVLAAGPAINVRTAAINVAGDEDYYSITLTAGNILVISADADPARTGAGTDLVVEVRDPADVLLLSFDSGITGSLANPSCESANYTITTSGTYFIKVRHFSAAGTGTYDLMASAATGSALAATPLIISEFRVRGPSGANDEYVEVYNTSNTDYTVSASDGSLGFSVASSDAVVRFVIPNGTVIPRHGHYLGTNSIAYSLGGYATGDATYTTDIPDNAGIALFRTSIPGNFSLTTRLDAVGSTSEANTLYKEGAGYPALTPFSIDYDFRRKTYTTPPQDTDNNANDFEFDDTNGTSAGAGQRLGAPGPENLASPISRDAGILVNRLDQSVGPLAAPNMVRDFTSDPPNNSTFGTISLRYRITNNTGVAVTRLRIRVDSIWTFPAPSGFADLRPRTSGAVVVAGINDATTCAATGAPATPPCTVTVEGTTLEQPPSQPNGGGFNSSMSVGVVTLGTPLANGASINIQLLFGIQQTGAFNLEFTPEILPVNAVTGPVAPSENITGNTDCTLTCPANVTQSNDPNQCGAVVTYPAPTISGSCGTVTATPASGSFFPIGTTFVNVTSTGGASCSFTVTVNDTQAPTITCPANITVCGSQAVSYPAPTVSDNCPGVTVNSVPASGSVFPVGTTTVTSTATDANGNTANCTFNVIVNPIPTVNVIANQTLCNNALTAAVNFTGTPGSVIYQWTNNTPSIGLPASGTGNIAPFTALNPGGAPVTATITVTPTTNSANVINTYAFTGAVQTWVVPAGVTSINIQAFGAQGNANAMGVSQGGLGGLASGTLTVTPGETLWIYAGGGGIVSATGGFNGGGNGGTTGTCLTALGGGGGGSSDVRQGANNLASRVIVAGGGGGTAGNRVAACARGAGGGGGGGYYGGGGGCGYPGTTGVVPTGGTQAAGGAGGVTGTTFGATNGAPGALGLGGAGGNEIFSNQGGSQAIIFGSGVGGGLTGGPGQQSGLNNFTGQSGAGGSSYTGGVTGGGTSAGVRSGNGQVIISYTLPGPAVICTGTPRTFTITVNPSPTITCPANITVPSAAGQCGAIVTYPAATATGTPAPVITYSIPSGSFFPVGVNTVTATATNTCGSAVCTFTITVLDNQPPTVTCPANVVVSNDPNLCSAVVNYNFPSFTDNCQRFQAPVNILPHGGGAITVAGNNLPGGFYFDLRNTTATPKLISSFQVRFGSVAFGAVPSPAPVSVFVTTSANTYVGNQANAAAWTTIGASIPVTVAGPNSEFSTVTLPGGGFILPPNTTKGIYLFGTVSSLVYDGAGTSNFNPITNGVLTLTPGQASSGLFVAALTPRVPNVVVNYITLSQSAGLPSGSAFPVGITTNTLVVTDDGGNSANCSFTVRVNDTQAPTVNCPANITVTTPTTSCTAIVNYTVTGSDNCPGVVTQLVSGPASGSAFPIGVTTVIWRAVDAAGNISTNCSFTVTVLDGQVPVISTQPANRTVCVGANATFSVVSTFANSYQWQSWNGTAWVNITGATASSFTVNNVTHAMNTSSYRVLITGPCGSVTTSNHASLYVNPLPTITISSNIPTQLLPTQFVTLTATGTPAGGSFVWFKNNAVIPGATASTLGPLSVLDAGTYKVRYTDPNGCVSTSADVIVSPLLTGNLYIYPNPNTGQFHVRFYNVANEEATITVYNYLGAIVYQQKHITGPLQYSIIDVDLGLRLAIGTYLVDVRNAQGLRIGAKLISIGRQ